MKEYRVVMMDSKELNREVKIFIMLPKTYYKSERFYPVLYMHDGQNLFDDSISYGGKSWGILDAYEENPDLPEVIIVGIENGGDERSNELVPFTFNFSKLGYKDWGEDDYGGKADEYLRFITGTVKPYIDKQFRTFKSPKNTAIMGSSFGGVNSTYAALTHTAYFSRFGCVSNAYWVIQDQIEKLAKSSDLAKVKKLYMDVGTKESSRAIENQNYIDSNQRMYDILKEKLDHTLIKYEVFEDAQHNEPAWRERFPDIIKFLFND